MNEEINIVESAIDRGVKAIVLAPSDTTALSRAVKKAKAAGIKVVIIDSKLDGPASQYDAFLATDNNAAGASLRQGNDRPGQGRHRLRHRQDRHRVLRRGRRLRSRPRRRVQGLHRQELQAQDRTTQYSQSDQVQALNQVTNILSSNPDLVGIFGANEPSAVGMGRSALQTLGFRRMCRSTGLKKS